MYSIGADRCIYIMFLHIEIRNLVLGLIILKSALMKLYKEIEVPKNVNQDSKLKKGKENLQKTRAVIV